MIQLTYAFKTLAHDPALSLEKMISLFVLSLIGIIIITYRYTIELFFHAYKTRNRSGEVDYEETGSLMKNWNSKILLIQACPRTVSQSAIFKILTFKIVNHINGIVLSNIRLFSTNYLNSCVN